MHLNAISNKYIAHTHTHTHTTHSAYYLTESSCIYLAEKEERQRKIEEDAHISFDVR